MSLDWLYSRACRRDPSSVCVCVCVEVVCVCECEGCVCGVCVECVYGVCVGCVWGVTVSNYLVNSCRMSDLLWSDLIR